MIATVRQSFVDEPIINPVIGDATGVGAQTDKLSKPFVLQVSLTEFDFKEHVR